MTFFFIYRYNYWIIKMCGEVRGGNFDKCIIYIYFIAIINKYLKCGIKSEEEIFDVHYLHLLNSYNF